MRADVNSDDKISFDLEDDSQVCFNFRGVNDAAIASRQLVDFIERERASNGFSLKIAKVFRACSCCSGESFPNLRQNVRAAVKRYFTDRPDMA